MERKDHRGSLNEEASRKRGWGSWVNGAGKRVPRGLAWAQGDKGMSIAGDGITDRWCQRGGG